MTVKRVLQGFLYNNVLYLIGKKLKFEDSDEEDSASPEDDDDSSEDESDSNMNTLKGMAVG